MRVLSGRAPVAASGCAVQAGRSAGAAFRWSRLTAAVLGLAAVVLGCGPPASEPAHSGLSAWEAERPDPQLAAAGSTVYGDFCSDCHGTRGGGSEWASAVNDIGLGPAEISRLVAAGVNPPSMPAFAGILSDAEIEAVAAYTVELRYSG